MAKSFIRTEPIGERSEYIQAARKKKLDKMKDKLYTDLEKQLTFRPKINEEYEFKQKREDFLTNIKNTEMRRKLRLEMAKQNAVAGQSFHPVISPYSQGISREEPVHERLYSLHRTLQEKEYHQMEKELQELQRDNKSGMPLFHPQISPRARTSIAPREEIVELALYKDAEERRQRREQLQQEASKTEQTFRTASKLTDSTVRFAKKKIMREVHDAWQEGVEMDDNGGVTFDGLANLLRRLGYFRNYLMQQSRSEDTSEDSSGMKYRLSDRGRPAAKPARQRPDVYPPDRQEEQLHQAIWDLLVDRSGGVVDVNAVSDFLQLTVDRATSSQASSLRDLGIGLGESDADAVATARALKKYRSTLQSYFVTKKTKVERAEDRELSFAPHISEVSKQLEALNLAAFMSAHGRDEIKSRHEILLEKAKLAESRIQKKREDRQKEELQECTFKPQIISQPSTRQLVSPTPQDDWHDRLYEARHQKPLVEDGRTLLDKEIDAHCTFKPDTTITQKSRTRAPKHTPRGYNESVERLRVATKERQVMKEAKEKIPAGENYDKVKSAPIKPFSFLQEQRVLKRPPPLLYVDVNLGPGRTGRIGIHEDDDPDVLAKNFAKAYQLDQQLQSRLTDLLTQHKDAFLKQRHGDSGSLA
eukprot:GILK01005627.1.p1 GENE.GILK01005627.1~~GILK01005627.1.p1  ORF type:complete len:709 (-),score=133.13 GILK01005627.1:161-2095(-)